jgi:hypothetical protein
MRVLVDEAMPVHVLLPLRLNKGHRFDHVEQLAWKGKKDVPLLRDAAAKGYEAILTLDVAQLDSIEESRELQRSGLHHIAIRQGRSAQGARGMTRIIASVIVAMSYVLNDLANADGQRIVELALLSASARHTIYDPRTNPLKFPYWR